MEKGMASAEIIMLVTGGGGALGQIIKDSGLGTYMAETLAGTAVPIVILPFLIATAMRFIQGSGTVAMTTAASISAPILCGKPDTWCWRSKRPNPYLFHYFHHCMGCWIC